MLLRRTNFKHISTVSHEGKVLIVATVVEQGQVSLFYTVKQDGFEKSAIQKTDGILWEDFKKVGLASNDEEARALRLTQTGNKPKKAWRVLHRVTDVERPALMGFGRDLRAITAAAELTETQQLTNRVNQLQEKLDKILYLLENPN